VLYIFNNKVKGLKMILSRTTACNVLDIWAPRWKDRTVMLAKYKIGTHNVVKFSKAKNLTGEYYISGEKVRKFPVEDNGKLACYCVPIDELEPLERE